MNIWDLEKWKVFYGCKECRTGVRIFYDKQVDNEIKSSIKSFVSWLRVNYKFPKRVRVYIKSQRRIKSQIGDMVCGTFFRPANRNVEPYIRIATGDYKELVENQGRDNALAEILWTIAHELTHYFQWLNALDLTLIGEERQATNYANRILKSYAETREHP